MTARTARSAPTSVVAGVATLAAAGLLLAGCGSSGATQSERGSQSFGTVSRVEVSSDAGTVQLKSGPDGSATVDRELRWSDEKPVVTQEVQGDVLRVRAECPDRDDCETELIVTVPAASSSKVELGAGNVSATGLTGAQDLKTAAGNVSGTGLGAADVKAQSSAGNVDLGFAAAPPTVDAESSAGNVTVRLPVGPVYEVDATTTAGTPTVGVPDTPGADSKIRARSSAGNVSVIPG